MGEQQQTGAAGANWQGRQSADDTPSGHGSLLPDSLSTSQQDDGDDQSGGQHHGKDGGDGIPVGSIGDVFVFRSGFSSGVSLDVTGSRGLHIDAAPRPEPTSLVLLLSALLGIAITVSGERQPALRYCTASSRRNR
jgi:hypothetical protein